MIYIISGEDVVSSRNKLSELLSGKENIVRLDGKKATIAELDEALLGGSLFSDSKVVVLEYFSKLKPEVRVWEILNQVQNDKSTDVILWDDIDLSKKKFPKKVQIFNFLFPKFYYAFLDSFEPNSKKTLELLTEVLKTFEPEQVLYGLVRRVRQLLIIKSNNYSEFSEFKRVQSWQISKLKKQANLWSENQLKKAFLELAKLDEKMKTSNLPLPLASHLDILLLSELN
ncbi:MAG: hypothetical protein A3C30_01045 [Candidatus Levybacteria bacterium RIFCSPHIGHO2_02_FULL_40_18]|nr:MAG: hypothetical protein A2869_03640 [Candidatus Levybacteria bacterium RIFCSPHIGHO2_01_FULL_40_58]OGH27292.1 MAG: hypothetical protein A3C30_01045 [Candidatus Levybacteria bacterium RIFCSPHIGHO2_02_FULL_40_18]OGH30941.1 MAG: hypothetical protein A3E43_04360 [Candidatus Levybacteria bacterium RIFCSPHIGHO2_12_FULL_40_31]OGH40952.1 MAG: hypothetical protein A2894_01575 [Candidatus Levybacteria bacterium RIFCSPLOWO2_01_FULL_40_64]OGH48971.1 MAG: hypothetical protein A3I54_02980 [Candidatus Lev